MRKSVLRLFVCMRLAYQEQLYGFGAEAGERVGPEVASDVCLKNF